MKRVLKALGLAFAITVAVVVAITVSVAAMQSFLQSRTDDEPQEIVQVSEESLPKPPSIQELFELTNAERVKAGLGFLSLTPSLNSSAQDKCNDMIAKNYYDHDTPDGQDFTVFIKDDFIKVGENLAGPYATSGVVVDAWMNSPGHRENLLDPVYTDVGFGICAKGVVQHLMQR